MLDKIQSFFGFTTMPFGRALAPGMLFRSADHAQAVARISYGITSRGITVITGEVGVGKTVAARAAIDRAEPARYHLIYIPDPIVRPGCPVRHGRRRAVRSGSPTFGASG
jgi:type II secretory pathway predicted ATPase ExeA